VQMLKAEHLRAEGNKEKLDKDIPHVNDSPDTCPNCELWGHAPAETKDGRKCCEGCIEELTMWDEEEAETTKII